ncbi:hypothetical protein ACOZGD_11690 [Streptomyces murinus]
MLLLRDREQNTAVGKLVEEHTRLVRETHAGTADLTAVHAAKLARALGHAAGSALYRHTADASVRADWPTAGLRDPRAVLRELFPRLPLLGKAELSAHGEEAFTRPLAEFLHYYESSGTTGNPVAAPKAVDDLVINTINIGELWAQFLQPRDVALILINAPFAPAAYQFEKVLEYVGVMSFRPWVDNITGDYGRVLRLIESLNANVFVGPPSRLLEMIQFAHRSGLPAPPLRPAAAHGRTDRTQFRTALGTADRRHRLRLLVRLLGDRHDGGHLPGAQSASPDPELPAGAARRHRHPARRRLRRPR